VTHGCPFPAVAMAVRLSIRRSNDLRRSVSTVALSIICVKECPETLVEVQAKSSCRTSTGELERRRSCARRSKRRSFPGHMAQEGDSRRGRATPEIELAARSGRGVRRLGPLLAWAGVFADLGTSVFYVPAILYAQVGGLAPAFVLIAAVAFVFVALEHLEVAYRYPGGGGGVAAAVEAFGPRVGVLSGALMVSAYLVTITISV